MAFVYKSDRKPSHFLEDNNQVGPGSYTFATPTPSKQSVAPFGSTAPKQKSQSTH